MEKVRSWCGQPLDRGRLKNRNRNHGSWSTALPKTYPCPHGITVKTLPIPAVLRQYVTSFGICHKGTFRLLQGPTSFDKMCSGFGWSGSDLDVPSNV